MQPLNKSLETSHGTIVIRESVPSDLMQYRELRLGALQDSPTAFSADYELNLNQPTNRGCFQMMIPFQIHLTQIPLIRMKTPPRIRLRI